MIINIETNKLETPMKNLSSVSDSKQTMPILGNTLFILKDGLLELVASDLEVEIKESGYEISIKMSGEGTLKVPDLDIIEESGGLAFQSDILNPQCINFDPSISQVTSSVNHVSCKEKA